jgi:hypothetical protein
MTEKMLRRMLEVIPKSKPNVFSLSNRIHKEELRGLLKDSSVYSSVLANQTGITRKIVKNK